MEGGLDFPQPAFVFVAVADENEVAGAGHFGRTVLWEGTESIIAQADFGRRVVWRFRR